MSLYPPVLLPEEIVMEILSGLPPKTMIRFKSVSKPWCSLFTSPSYMAKTLLPDRDDDDDNLLLVKHYHKTTLAQTLSLLSNRTLAKHDDQQSRTLLLPYNGLYRTEILGTCNDLVCVHYGERSNPSVVMWSLATGNVRILPPLLVPRSECSQLGFGYDAASQDYKVIRVGDETSVEIYSFNSDSWRDVPVYIPASAVIGNHRACINGIFLWTAIHHLEDLGKCCWDLVLWFRFGDETFGTFKLPPNRSSHFTEGQHYVNKFLVLNDRMGLVVYDRAPKPVERLFRVWVMLEFGVEGSWTLLFTLGPLVGIEVPLWFWNNGKMIMQHGDGHFVLCDPFGQEIEPLEVDATPDDNLTYIQIISVPAKYIYKKHDTTPLSTRV